MKQTIIKLGLLMALPLMSVSSYAAVPAYDMAAAKANAQADFANWMKYLPDEVFVAHVSIPGTHDTATGYGFCAGPGGATYSQTQMARIDQQLDGGIRAFDIRPGTNSGKLYCCHGSDVTNYTMEDAFKLFTDYLEAHPQEFFIIHLFKGNVDSADSTFENLIDNFFNKGKYADYIIDYNPRLKVGDVRKKIILFRRDRLSFVTFNKAGNFGEWPWEDDVWANGADRHKTLVTHAIDPTIKGYMRVSDMSSPDDQGQVDDKKVAVKNLYDWCRTQPTPNEKKAAEGSYKPDWAMTFTSGEYKGVRSGFLSGGRNGYAYCANQLNPHYTNLINNTPAAEKGPCGIILADWVLTDYSQDNDYQVFGNELVPAIAMNNFDYIDKFILDDALFGENDIEYENIWDPNKEYFMRNVGTGDFLSAGEWWGTHATTAAHGLKVKLTIEKETGKYTINTTLNAGGTFGRNFYVDNTNDPAQFDVESIGDGKFILSANFEGDVYQTLGVEGVWSEFAADGTTHNVIGVTKNADDPYQQWEIIAVEDYLQQQLKAARRDKGVDVSFLIPGGRFYGNDTENNTWSITNKNHVYDFNGVGESNNRRCLTFYSKAKSGASWNLSKTVTGLPKGYYTIRWHAYHGTGHSDVKMNVNGVSFDGQKQGGTATVSRSGNVLNYSYSINDDNRKKIYNELATGNFQCELANQKITNGQFTITASDGAHSTYGNSIFVLDDFELIYYGPIYPVLERAIDDAKRRLEITDDSMTPDWLKTYETNMNNLTYSEADEGAAPALEIYQKLRELTLAQEPNDYSHQDYTNAFINAGFETGTLMGWETSYQGEGNDTDVKPNEGVYVTKGGHNAFLFNCWQEDPNPENRGRGVILSQTIPGLPAGHYMVTAQAANDDGDCMYIEVNGQRSDAIVVEGANNISKLISFEFEVAENTDEVTVSFMGGNSDGTFDDYGGNWYKLDDVRLYRMGTADYCVFYRRLLTALQRVEKIAAQTLPQYYQDKWDNENYHQTIANLIEEHINSDHSEGDLNGSNGLEERTELFNHFSAVVLSQAETKANMSGAIRNNSFELGDLSYWNTKASPVADAVVTDNQDENRYNVSGRDEKYIYFADLHDYQDLNGEAYPIYQSISGLPKGMYRLSVSLASTPGNTFYLAANGNSQKITAESADAFQNAEVEFEITENNSDLLLGLYPSADGNFTSQEANAEVKGPWFAVDNFQLWLIGRQVSIDWTMETPTHGTIILPFEVNAEELTEKGLEVYSVTAHVESTAEGATHHILQYTQQPSIEAHTPYLVKVAGAETEIQSVAKKAPGKFKAEATTGNVYTFEGFTQHEQISYTDTYSNGSLTGMLVETNAEAEQYHLQDYEGNIGFVRHEEGVEHETFAPYHAYITLPASGEDEPNIHGLYFEEPTLPLDWFMEGENYGTIILPFEAEIPEALNAYTVTGIGERKAMPEGYEGSYHLLTIESVAETDGVRLFEANVPYLVVMKSAEASQEPEAEIEPVFFSAMKKAADGETEENAPTAVFRGKATNTSESNTVGLLTGVHVDKVLDPSEGIHVISESENNAGFLTNYTIQQSRIDAHHAYISAAQLPQEHGEYLLLKEPQSDVETGIEDILAANANVDVYTVGGMLISTDTPAAEALSKLASGIYILRAGKVTVKVIK